jgi:hypothetical protein
VGKTSFNRVVLSPYDSLRELEWLIGDWVNEDEDSVVESSYRWDTNKAFLLNDFSIRVKGKKVLTGTQRIGRDPLTKQIKAWVFDSEGGNAESLWSSLDDGWIMKAKGVRSDGKVVTVTNQLTEMLGAPVAQGDQANDHVPNNQKYQRFLNQLLEVYHDAKRSAGDGRLSEEGRKHRVAELEGRLCDVLLPHPLETTPEMPPHEHDFTNLVKEFGRVMMAEELFTFVLEPEVEATNNGMERELRHPALGTQSGPHEQNCARSASAERDRERAAIAASKPGRFQLYDSAGGDWPLDERRYELVRKAMAIATGRGSHVREHRLACSLNRRWLSATLAAARRGLLRSTRRIFR